MPGKLRVNRVRRIQQRLGAGQIRHIGMVFVGKNRVVRQAHLLGALDFRVPVGTLDQAAHQAQLVFAANGDDVLDQVQRPCLVSLHGQTEALPLRAMRGHLGGQGFKHVK